MEVTRGIDHLQETAPTSISSLNPSESAPLDQVLNAVITLIWPFSSSTKHLALLLAERDFRLRSNRGQVRVQLQDDLAEAVAKTHISIGDVLTLSLDGAQWVEETAAVKTPGKSVERELVYKRRLLASIAKQGQEPILIDVKLPEKVSRSYTETNGTQTPLPSTPAKILYPDIGKWSSSAFFRSSAGTHSGGSASPYDPFGNDLLFEERPRKRTKFWRASGQWTYAGTEPTSDTSQKMSDSLDIFGFDGAGEVQVNPTANSSSLHDAEEALARHQHEHAATPESRVSTKEQSFLDNNEDAVALAHRTPPPLHRLQTDSRESPAPEGVQQPPKTPSSPQLKPVQSALLPDVSPLATVENPVPLDRSAGLNQHQAMLPDQNMVDPLEIYGLNQFETADQREPPKIVINETGFDHFKEWINLDTPVEFDKPDHNVASGSSDQDELRASDLLDLDNSKHLESGPEDRSMDVGTVQGNIVSTNLRTEQHRTQEASGVDRANGFHDAPAISNVANATSSLPSQDHFLTFEGGSPGQVLAKSAAPQYDNDNESNLIESDSNKPTEFSKVDFLQTSPVPSQTAQLDNQSLDRPTEGNQKKPIIIDLSSESEGEGEREKGIKQPLAVGRQSHETSLTEEGKEKKRQQVDVGNSDEGVQESRAREPRAEMEEVETGADNAGNNAPQSPKTKEKRQMESRTVIANSESGATDLEREARFTRQWNDSDNESPSTLQSLQGLFGPMSGTVKERAKEEDQSKQPFLSSKETPLGHENLAGRTQRQSFVQEGTLESSSAPTDRSSTAMPLVTAISPDKENAGLLEQGEEVEGSRVEAGERLQDTSDVVRGSDFLPYPNIAEEAADISQNGSRNPVAEEETVDDVSPFWQERRPQQLQLDASYSDSAERKTSSREQVMKRVSESNLSHAQDTGQLTPEASQEQTLLPGTKGSESSTRHRVDDILDGHFPPTPQTSQIPPNMVTKESQEAHRAPISESGDLQTPVAKKSSRPLVEEEVPDVISPWFSSRRSSRKKQQEEEAAHKREAGSLVKSGDSSVGFDFTHSQALPNKKATISGSVDGSFEEHQKATHNTRALQTSVDALSKGLRTLHSYYTPLSKLGHHLNSSSQFAQSAMDVLAVVTSFATKAERAKYGPKDYFTVLHVSDVSTYPATFQVQIFRPFSASLPAADIGDVILLRSFTVKSRKRQCYLLSAEGSGWCVWRFTRQMRRLAEESKHIWSRKRQEALEQDFRECKGPPVEYGEGERNHAFSLRNWWESISAGKESAEVDVAEKESKSQKNSETRKDIQALLVEA